MTLEPPPFAAPLHWLIEVVRVLYKVVVGPTHDAGTVFASPRHALVVTTDVPIPVSIFRLLVTVTSHVGPFPPVFTAPLHWSTD